MNRASRREAARSRGGRALLDYADTYRCPDCLSEIGELRRQAIGTWVLLVVHDDTCPNLRSTGEIQ